MHAEKLIRKSVADGKPMTVAQMLDLLSLIEVEASRDPILDEFAVAIGTAIDMLNELRRAAHAVMLEAESQSDRRRVVH